MGRTKPSATRKRGDTSYIQPAASISPKSTTIAAMMGVLTPMRMAASAAAFSLDASPVAAMITTAASSASSSPQDLGRPSFCLDLHNTSAIPGLSAIEPPQIESECVDVPTSVAVEATTVREVEKVTAIEAATEIAELAKEAVVENAWQQRHQELEDGSSEAETSPSTAETENDDTTLPAPLTASLSPSRPQSPSLAASPLPQCSTQQQTTQPSSPSPIATTPVEAAREAKPAPRPPMQERMVTITVTELERWQQRVISHIEAHFSNEQLKRIAEFGRAHANLLVEAKEYVYNLETQLSAQFDKERADIRAQAEAFVAQAQLENQQLLRTIAELRHEIVLLRLPSRRNRITIADDDEEDDGEDDDDNEAVDDNDAVEVAADVAVESSEDAEEVSSDSRSSSDGSPRSPEVEVVAISRKQVRHHGRDDRDDCRKKDRRLLHLGDDGRKLKTRRAISRHVSVSSMVVDQVGEAG